MGKTKKVDLDDYRAEIQGAMITLVLAFEHIDHGRDAEWLRTWLKEFNKFAVDFQNSGFPYSELEDILKDEIDFDLAAEFAKCSDNKSST